MRKTRFVCFGIAILGVSALGCKPRELTSVVADADGDWPPASRSGDPLWGPWMSEFQAYAKVTNERGDRPLDKDEQIGRFIWYFATGGNAKYHSNILAQAVGLRTDYWDVFKSERRGSTRFKKWGVIPDPSCIPASQANVESYGFDVCPGDLGENGLLAAVGNPDAFEGWEDSKDGYWKNDPACTIAGDCRLHFGTSVGAVGFRKFPNPKFNKKKWAAIGGWQGYQNKMRGGTHLEDDSIDPPFLIGHSCGSCHVSYNPENPPSNVEAPEWANIKGAIGAQYLHISELLGSGMPKDSLEWQIFTHSRPGTSDTSAVTHDGITNPGTMNQIINFATRPGLVNFMPEQLGTVQDQNELDTSRHKHDYKYFDFFDGAEAAPSWKSAGQHPLLPEVIPQILKGGEDTVGAIGAIQRVYLNIGMCAEACTVNHLQDLRVLVGRKSRQTPLRIDQCMRDCPEFRSVARNTLKIAKFLVAQQPAELYRAKGLSNRDELVTELGADKVKMGMEIFAVKCTKCHSSRISKDTAYTPEDLIAKFTSKTDRRGRPNPSYLFATNEGGTRFDWLGNDEMTEVTEIGTFKCRSLHSNHMQGHLWAQYGSSTLRGKQKVDRLPESVEPSSGPDGRGYLRNISLLSAWAFAPFMHNNGLGQELCNYNRDNDLMVLPSDWGTCMPPDRAVSVNGRLEVFGNSLKALFNPETRANKVTRTDAPISFPLGGPNAKVFGKALGFNLEVPEGISTTLLGSIDQRKMAQKIIDDINERGFEAWKSDFPRTAQAFETRFLERDYVNCGGRGQEASVLYEDQGHNILTYNASAGTDVSDDELNEEEMNALITFMQTL